MKLGKAHLVIALLLMLGKAPLVELGFASGVEFVA